jgi:hypothetical protein
MQVTVEIPDQLIPTGGDPARMLLEEAVAKAYREGRLETTEQVRKLLGFGTRAQATTFLLEHEIYDYTIEELQKDLATLEHLFPTKRDQPQT